VGKLESKTLNSLPKGKHSDGDGLILVVARPGVGSWVVRYQVNGRRRDMGLGAYPAVGLAKARQLAAAIRQQTIRKVDPLAEREAPAVPVTVIPTFAQMAERTIAGAVARLMVARLEYLWRRLLGPEFCGPILKRPVNEITTSDIADVLRPVWSGKPEIARKLYPAIKRVFDGARIELRDRHNVTIENPARWDDLKALEFQQPPTLTRGSHPALPYKQMPEFMAALRARGGRGALLLEFVVLTNCRTGSARLATFSQFDLDAEGGPVWTIPLENLKDQKHRKEPFRIPLSPRAVEIVRTMEAVKQSAFVFPGRNPGTPMSSFAAISTIDRMNEPEPSWVDPTSDRLVTPHGFRATFKTWCEETSAAPHAVVEICMGHSVGTAVERVYTRTDLMDKRRALMNAWANYCKGVK
jgi:integrase